MDLISVGPSALFSVIIVVYRHASAHPFFRLQVSLSMRGDDPGVEDLCWSHSAVGHSQMCLALGRGKIDLEILSRRDQV